MSVNWSRYSTPEETRAQGRKAPEMYGVIKLLAGNIREIPGLSVEHDPEWPDNRSHTEIYGNKKDQQTRLLLMRASHWEILVAA
jgi:hypothetical protein